MSNSSEQKKKKRRKILIPIFCLLGAGAMACAVVGIVKDCKPQSKTITIKLESGGDLPSSIEIDQEIIIAAYDSNGKPVEGASFVSGDDNVFTITGNIVKGIGVGTTTITATAEGYETATATLSVTQPQPKTMTIKLEGGQDLPSSIEIDQEITIAAYDSDGKVVEGATFASDDDSVFTITGNIVKGVGVGSATITATAEGYETATSNLEVTLKTMYIRLDDGKEIESILVGQEITIAAFDKDGNKVEDAAFSTTSSTITLNENVVRGENPGTAEITCNASLFEETSCSFDVKKEVSEYDVELSWGLGKYYSSFPEVEENAFREKLGVSWELNPHAVISSVVFYNTDDDTNKYEVSNFTSTGFSLPRDIVSQIDFEKVTIEISATMSYDVNVQCGEGIVNAQTKVITGDDIEIECEVATDYDGIEKWKLTDSSGNPIVATVVRSSPNKIVIRDCTAIEQADVINVELSASTAKERYSNITISAKDNNVDGRIQSAIVEDDIQIRIMMPDTHTLNLDKPTVEKPETVGTNIVIGSQTYYSDDFTYVETNKDTCVLTIPKALCPAEPTDSIQVNLISVGKTIKSTVTLEDGGLIDYEVTYNKADKNFEVVFDTMDERILSKFNTHVDLIGVPGVIGSLGVTFIVDQENNKISITMDDPSIRNYLLPLRGTAWDNCVLQIHAFSEYQ